MRIQDERGAKEFARDEGKAEGIEIGIVQGIELGIEQGEDTFFDERVQNGFYGWSK